MGDFSRFCGTLRLYWLYIWEEIRVLYTSISKVKSTHYAPSSRGSKTNINPSLMSVEGSFQTHLLTALDWCLSIISRWEKNFFVASTCLLSCSKTKFSGFSWLLLLLIMRNQNLLFCFYMKLAKNIYILVENLEKVTFFLLQTKSLNPKVTKLVFTNDHEKYKFRLKSAFLFFFRLILHCFSNGRYLFVWLCFR